MTHIATETFVSARTSTAAAETAIQAWRSLHRHLVVRHREVNAEVAHYPTPIARCDEQLSKLLEERARLYRDLERAASIGEPPSADAMPSHWLNGLSHFVANAEPDCDDSVELALRSALSRAVAALQNGPSGD